MSLGSVSAGLNQSSQVVDDVYEWGQFLGEGTTAKAVVTLPPVLV